MKRTITATLVVESEEQNDELLKHAVCGMLVGSEHESLGEWPEEFNVASDHSVAFQIMTAKIGDEVSSIIWNEDGSVSIPESKEQAISNSQQSLMNTIALLEKNNQEINCRIAEIRKSNIAFEIMLIILGALAGICISSVFFSAISK